MTITTIKVEGIDYNELTGINIIETAHAHGICELSFVLGKEFDAAQMLKLDKQGEERHNLLRACKSL